MTHLRAISGLFAFLGAMILLATTLSTSAVAQSGDPIKVTVGKTTLLRLEERPEIIFIGNPAYVDIILEKNGVAFLIGRQTGETSMHLLDEEGRLYEKADGGQLDNQSVVLAAGGAPCSVGSHDDAAEDVDDHEEDLHRLIRPCVTQAIVPQDDSSMHEGV